MSTDATSADENPRPTANPETGNVDDSTTATVSETNRSETPSATAKPARKISIGSQRDVAEPVIKPKAVQEAIANPIEITAKEERPQVAAEVRSTVGLSENLDAEIEAIMSSFSMDSVVENAQAAESQLESKTRLKAVVAKIHGEHVFFSLPGQYEGIASVTQFKTPPVEGDTLDVIVRELNKDDGLYELSIPGAAVSVADWDDINEGDVVEATVTGSNAGGLEATVNKLNGFIPASQIDRFRVENFDDYVGKKMQCVVMEVNPEKRKLVVSHRGVIERENEAKRKDLLETLEVGQLMDGTVTKLMDFGAFVDLGGVEGLIHISKLAWNRVKHPSEVVDVGQKVKVKVEKFDKQTGKISLSHRDTLEHPWEGIEQKYQVNDIVTGKVTRIAQFGAFVQLESGIEGLVHISEIDYKRVVAVKNFVNEGDQVTVKILSIDPQNNKIGLSLKATQAPPVPKEIAEQAEEDDDTPVRDQIVPKHKGPLKGGTGGDSGGEQFGLKW